MNEHTTDPVGDRPKRFVSRAWLEQYQQSGTGRLTILSGSMAPLINTGDQICVRKTALDRIHVGDIITFWKGEVLVTHRVIRTCLREGSVCFVERGDAVGHHALCRGQSVIGRVIAVKKGKREFDFETLRWKACNRIMGIGLFGAYAVRVYGRRMPWIPRWIRACVQRVYAILSGINNKFMGFLLRY
jgi:signal peptidase I